MAKAVYWTVTDAEARKRGEIFIDDSPLNIDGACAVGMPGAVWLNDMPRLRARMRANGIPVKE